MTAPPQDLDESIPEPLRVVVRAVIKRFPGRVDIETTALRDSDESAVTFIPRNQGASVFCMYDGVDGHDSFYIWAGEILNAEFEEADDLNLRAAVEWAVELISNIGQFGIFSIVVKSRWSRTLRTKAHVPASQAELDCVSPGGHQIVGPHSEP